MSSFFEKLKRGMDIEETLEEKENFQPLKESLPRSQKKEEKLESQTQARKKTLNTAGKKKKAGKRKKEKNEKEIKKIKIKEEKPAVFGKAAENKKDKKQSEPAGQNFSIENLGGQEGELAVDIYQTDKDVVIRSAIAGVGPNDLDISIENDMVIIKGERREAAEEEKKDYFLRECYWGYFSREIVLPEEVDNSRAQASLKNGVLTIRMPKIERSKRRKIIIE
jgi:HSP20 family protein